MTTKLTNSEIAALVAEKEAELEKEAERLKFEQSLRNLIVRMEKKGYYLGRTLFAHTKPKEKDRWEVKTYRPIS